MFKIINKDPERHYSIFAFINVYIYMYIKEY